MRVREALPEDAAMLAEFNSRLLADERHPNPLSLEDLRARMHDWLARREYRCCLFEDGGATVAYALFAEDDEQVCLRQFFVVPERRRRGHGRAAMAMLKQEVWPADKQLIVEVFCHNAVATAFWRAMGYEDYYLGLRIPPRG